MLIESKFTPAIFCRSPHTQTILANTIRATPAVDLIRERLELDDGDFLDLDWTEHFPGKPTVLVLHGLEGNSDSNYAAGILKACSAQKLNAVLMHSRGCSGEPNRLLRRYHAGSTDDMATVAKLILQRWPAIPLYAVAYSLGGNALLKWLGETGNANPLAGAVAVSVPFDLSTCARRMEHGFSRFYQRHLLQKMKLLAIEKREMIAAQMEFPDLNSMRTFTDFDDVLTAPVHGFEGAAHYYAASSCKQFLSAIKKPTLIIQALDDPFMYAHSMPEEKELSASTSLEWSLHGGHVGFIHKDSDRRFWLEHRIPKWIQNQLSS